MLDFGESNEMFAQNGKTWWLFSFGHGSQIVKNG